MINGGKKEITGRSEQTWVFFTRRIGLKHNILLRISLRPLLACGSGSAHFTEANSQALSMGSTPQILRTVEGTRKRLRSLNSHYALQVGVLYPGPLDEIPVSCPTPN